MAAGRKAALRAPLTHWATWTPAERARYRLPEVGWQRSLFGHLPEFDSVYSEGSTVLSGRATHGEPSEW
jgi:hypothetical protein